MSERAITAKTSETWKKKSSSHNQGSNFFQSAYSPIVQILHLQKTLGNQAVQRLFRLGLIQAKLTINKPNDIYEQEADRVANQVMRMPEPTIQPKPS
jgi:hypothetical protein